MGKYYFRNTLKGLTEEKITEICKLYPVEEKGRRVEFSELLKKDEKVIDKAFRSIKTTIANDLYDTYFGENFMEFQCLIKRVERVEGKLRLQRDLAHNGNILIDLAVSHCPHGDEIIDRIYEYGRDFANYIIRGKNGKEMIQKLEKEYKTKILMVKEGLEEDLITSLIDIIQDYILPLNSGYVFGYSGECNYIGYEKESEEE